MAARARILPRSRLLRFDASPAISARRSDVAVSKPTSEDEKATRRRDAIRERARHYSEQIEFRLLDKSLPAEELVKLNDLKRVQYEILNEDTLAGTQAAVKRSSQSNFDIGMRAYHACLKTVPHEAPLTDKAGHGYARSAYCERPCSDAGSCSMDKAHAALLGLVKTCGPNHYPKTKTADFGHFGYADMCSLTCNPDLSPEMPQPCQHGPDAKSAHKTIGLHWTAAKTAPDGAKEYANVKLASALLTKKRFSRAELEGFKFDVTAADAGPIYVKATDGTFYVPDSARGCSQLRVSADGNRCVCGADMRFTEANGCRTSTIPHDGPNPACQPMYGGPNCNHIDATFTSAKRRPLKPTDPDAPTFEAFCPLEHQYKDRGRCLKGSSCISNANDNPPLKGKLDPKCHLAPNAFKFTNRGKAGGECLECTHSDGTDRPTRREIVKCGGQFMCQCPERLHYADRDRCEPAIAGSSLVVTTSNAATDDKPATVSAKRAAFAPLIGGPTAAPPAPAGEAVRLEALMQKNPDCAKGMAGLHCEVCADGFERNLGPDGHTIAGCSPISRDNCGPDPHHECFACHEPTMQPGRTACGRNCNPNPFLDESCRKLDKGCCKKDGPRQDCSTIKIDPRLEPCCKNPRFKVDRHGRCVCANKGIADQESCDAHPPHDASREHELGFAVFDNILVDRSHVSEEWTRTAHYSGSADVKACPEPCAWKSREEALKACAQWDECMGVYEVDTADDTGFPFDDAASDKRDGAKPSASGKRASLIFPVSARVGRLLAPVPTDGAPPPRRRTPSLVVPVVSAKASVFRPIRSDGSPLIASSARLRPKGSTPDGAHAEAATRSRGVTVYTKLCKEARRDPKKDCKECISPYVLQGNDCVCPPQFEADTEKGCLPTRCKPGSGLDPGSRCEVCLNPNMKPNKDHVCVCDPASTHIDPQNCGGLDGKDPIKCHTGSGLQPPDCKSCRKPLVKDFFTEVSAEKYCAQPDTLIRTLACGKHSKDDCKTDEDCLKACVSDPNCGMLTLDDDGKCSLYRNAPAREHCDKDRVITKGTRMFFQESFASPSWDEQRGTCVCPHDGQTIDPKTGVCKCKNARYSPDTCGRKVQGTYKYYDKPTSTYAQAKAACYRKSKGKGKLITLHEDSQQERLEDVLPMDATAFIGAKKGTVHGASVFQWEENKETFFNVSSQRAAGYIGPDVEQKKGVAGLVTSSTVDKSNNCLLVRKTAQGVRWEPSPCDVNAGYVCEINPMPVCRNDTLDPATDCKECRDKNFKPDPVTFECEGHTGINPEWRARDGAPPVKKFEKMVPSTLEYYKERTHKFGRDKFTNQILGAGKPTGNGGCAEMCHKLQGCVGWMQGEYDYGGKVGRLDAETCVFLGQKSGLGLDAKGNTIATPDKTRDTYLLQPCVDDRLQYWSDAKCVTYEGTELTVDGKCPEEYAYKDTYYCERHSECRTTGIQDGTTEGDSGFCNAAICSPGVESSDPKSGKTCDKCKYKNTLGDISGDMRDGNCLKCLSRDWKPDGNHIPFDHNNPGDCQCLPAFENRDPRKNCCPTCCLPGHFGFDCSLTRDSCHGRGVPTESATEYDVHCSCDRKGKDNKGSFPIHVTGETCDECADGYGPEPKLNGKYACSVRLSDTKCGPLGLPIGANVDPRDPKKTQCDCRALNASYHQAENGFEPPGHWTGELCDKCDDTTEVRAFAETDRGKKLVIKDKRVTLDGVPYTVDWKGIDKVPDVTGVIGDVHENPGGPVRVGDVSFPNPLVKVKAYGGEHCNLSRQLCNERGTPGANGKYGAAESPECVCDGNTNFRSGAKSTCGDGDCTESFYGKLCDVPIHACGAIHGHQFGPDPNYEKAATPADPKCLCDSPELMTGLTYDAGQDGPTKCVCLDPLVLLAAKDSKTPKCVDKHEYCYNRGTYDPTKISKSGEPGACECKEGYAGDRCDECADGFANIQGSPLTDVTGRCDNVQEYCNYHADTTRGKSGFDEVNHKCHCTAEYDVSQDSTCKAPYCSEGHSPFTGMVPAKNADGTPAKNADGTPKMEHADSLRCVNNFEACGANARAVGFAIHNDKCICHEDMRTGEFYVGNTRPYGADGQTINPTPLDPYRPSPNDVCQYGPDYCNYPNGSPTEIGECKCQTEGVYASSGEQCQFSRGFTWIHDPPLVDPKTQKVTTPARSHKRGHGCWDRGKPIYAGDSARDFLGVGLEWMRGDNSASRTNIAGQNFVFRSVPKSADGLVVYDSPVPGSHRDEVVVPGCSELLKKGFIDGNDNRALKNHYTPTEDNCPTVDDLPEYQKLKDFLGNMLLDEIVVPAGFAVDVYQSTLQASFDYNVCQGVPFKSGVGPTTLTGLRTCAAVDVKLAPGFTCRPTKPPARKFENEKLAERIRKHDFNAGNLQLDWKEFDEMGMLEDKMNDDLYIMVDKVMYTPVPRGRCQCDDQDVSGRFCQYTFMHTCNGRGQPRMDGRCGTPMHEPKLGQLNTCLDDYSGFDCSVPPLGAPNCPFVHLVKDDMGNTVTNCRPGCLEGNAHYNGCVDVGDSCNESAAIRRCCAGKNSFGGGHGSAFGISQGMRGCGWFNCAGCDDDPNAGHYPCICNSGAVVDGSGDLITGSGHGSGTAKPFGWRHRPENENYPFATAITLHQNEVNTLDSNYVPIIDTNIGK